MCHDPLGRAQLLVAEAIEGIQMIAEAEEKRAAHDPGVVEAVRARLREIEARLREVQAGYSRRDGWRVTREVIRELVVIAIELLLRASTTSSNCSPFAVLTLYAPRLHNSSLPSRERALPVEAGKARRGDPIFSLARRARQARTDAQRPAPSRRALERAVRGAARRRAGRRHGGPELARRDGKADRGRAGAAANRSCRTPATTPVRGRRSWPAFGSLTFPRSSTLARRI